MLDRNIAIYRTRSSLRFMRSITWFGLVLSGFLLLGEIRLADYASLSFLVIAICFLAFGSLLFLRLRRDFDRRPIIELREEGLVARDISPQLIEWADIEDVQLARLYGQDVINLQLAKETVSTHHFTFAAIVNFNINKIFGTSSISLNLSGIDWDPEQLAGLIAREAEEAGQQLEDLYPETGE
jgi:hypothetical protein